MERPALKAAAGGHNATLLRRGIHTIALIAVALVSIVGCGGRPSSEALAATLPLEVRGVATSITTPAPGELSGLVTDDALAAVGKSRNDSAIAVAIAQPDLLVVAFAVAGLQGKDLVEALVDTWPPSGPTSEVAIGDKTVLLREGASDVYFYVYGDTVYVVETADATVANDAIRQLP